MGEGADSAHILLPAPPNLLTSGITVIVYHFRSSMQCDDNEKIDPGISGTALMGLNAQLPCEGSPWPCRTSGVPEAP